MRFKNPQGRAAKISTTKMSTPESFFSKLWKNPSSGCWVWTGWTPPGYEQVRVMYHKRQWLLARLVWTLVKGIIPPGMVVCHTCDFPRCGNPAHLFLGTIQDNEADKVAKGRQAKGSKNGWSKLTEVQVEEIRRRYTGRRGEQTALAKEFGVQSSTIQYIVKGVLWRHVA